MAARRVVRRGVTMVEYGLMVAMIGAALIVVISILAQTFKGSYGRANTAIEGALAADAGASPAGPVPPAPPP